MKFLKNENLFHFFMFWYTSTRCVQHVRQCDIFFNSIRSTGKIHIVELDVQYTIVALVVTCAENCSLCYNEYMKSQSSISRRCENAISARVAQPTNKVVWQQFHKVLNVFLKLKVLYSLSLFRAFNFELSRIFF